MAYQIGLAGNERAQLERITEKCVGSRLEP